MKKVFLSFVTIVTVTISSTAQKITLQLTKGQKMTIHQTSNIENTVEAMGQTMESKVSNDNTEEAIVNDANKDQLIVASTLKKIKANINSMGKEGNYDSEKKDNDSEVEEMYQNLLNKTTTYTIGINGNLIKEDKPTTKDAGQQTMKMLSGDMGIAGPTFYLPSVLNKELVVGASWVDSVETKSKINSKTINNYKVVSITSSVAEIENIATQTLNGSMEQMGQEMNMSGTNTIAETLKIDTKTGVLIERVKTIKMDMTIEAMGMSIPSKGTVIAKTIVTLN